MEEIIRLATELKFRAKSHITLYAQEYYRGNVAKIARPSNDIEDYLILCELQKWLMESKFIKFFVEPIEVGTGGVSGIRYSWYYLINNDSVESNTPIGFGTYGEALKDGILNTLKSIKENNASK